jgi:hypothetical protein
VELELFVVVIVVVVGGGFDKRNAPSIYRPPRIAAAPAATPIIMNFRRLRSGIML